LGVVTSLHGVVETFTTVRTVFHTASLGPNCMLTYNFLYSCSHFLEHVPASYPWRA
jgi:hypothetical protein